MASENATNLTPYNRNLLYAAGIVDKLIILPTRETKQAIREEYSVRNAMNTTIRYNTLYCQAIKGGQIYPLFVECSSVGETYEKLLETNETDNSPLKLSTYLNTTNAKFNIGHPDKEINDNLGLYFGYNSKHSCDQRHIFFVIHTYNQLTQGDFEALNTAAWTNIRMEITTTSAADASSSLENSLTKTSTTLTKGNLRQIQKSGEKQKLEQKEQVKLEIIGVLESILAVMHFGSPLIVAVTKVFSIILSAAQEQLTPYLPTFMGFYPYCIAPPLNPRGKSLDTPMTECSSFDFKIDTYFGLEMIQKALCQRNNGYQEYYYINPQHFMKLEGTIEILSTFNLSHAGPFTQMKPASDNVVLMSCAKLNRIFPIYISNPPDDLSKLDLNFNITTTFDNLQNYLLKDENNKAIDSEKEILSGHELFFSYYCASSSTSWGYNVPVFLLLTPKKLEEFLTHYTLLEEIISNIQSETYNSLLELKNNLGERKEIITAVSNSIMMYSYSASVPELKSNHLKTLYYLGKGFGNKKFAYTYNNYYYSDYLSWSPGAFKPLNEHIENIDVKYVDTMIKKYDDNLKKSLEARYLKSKFTDPNSPTEEEIIGAIIGLGHDIYKAIQSPVSIVHSQFAGKSSYFTPRIYVNVESIGPYAFNRHKTLRWVYFRFVKRIEPYTFSYCQQLEVVIMPSVTTICQCAFQHCTSLEKIKFLRAEKVDASAFEGCIKLQDIVLPNQKIDLCQYPSNGVCGFMRKKRAATEKFVWPEIFHTFQPTLRIHCSVNADSLAEKRDEVDDGNFDVYNTTLLTTLKQLKNNMLKTMRDVRGETWQEGMNSLDKTSADSSFERDSAGGSAMYYNEDPLEKSCNAYADLQEETKDNFGIDKADQKVNNLPISFQTDAISNDDSEYQLRSSESESIESALKEYDMLPLSKATKRLAVEESYELLSFCELVRYDQTIDNELYNGFENKIPEIAILLKEFPPQDFNTTKSYNVSKTTNVRSDQTLQTQDERDYLEHYKVVYNPDGSIGLQGSYLQPLMRLSKDSDRTNETSFEVLTEKDEFSCWGSVGLLETINFLIFTLNFKKYGLGSTF